MGLTLLRVVAALVAPEAHQVAAGVNPNCKSAATSSVAVLLINVSAVRRVAE